MLAVLETYISSFLLRREITNLDQSRFQVVGILHNLSYMSTVQYLSTCLFVSCVLMFVYLFIVLFCFFLNQMYIVFIST